MQTKQTIKEIIRAGFLAWNENNSQITTLQNAIAEIQRNQSIIQNAFLTANALLNEVSEN